MYLENGPRGLGRALGSAQKRYRWLLLHPLFFTGNFSHIEGKALRSRSWDSREKIWLRFLTRDHSFQRLLFQSFSPWHNQAGKTELCGNFLNIRGLKHLWMNKEDWRCQRCSLLPCFRSWALSCLPLAGTGHGIATCKNFPRMRGDVVLILSFLGPPLFMF